MFFVFIIAVIILMARTKKQARLDRGPRGPQVYHPYARKRFPSTGAMARSTMLQRAFAESAAELAHVAPTPGNVADAEEMAALAVQYKTNETVENWRRFFILYLELSE